MRKRKNGFTQFMSVLDGKPEVAPKVDTSHFTVPDGLILDAIRLTIDDLESSGDTRYLSSCFTWASTPQGFEYWCDIEEYDTTIDDEGINYLYWLLEQET